MNTIILSDSDLNIINILKNVVNINPLTIFLTHENPCILEYNKFIPEIFIYDNYNNNKEDVIYNIMNYQRKRKSEELNLIIDIRKIDITLKKFKFLYFNHKHYNINLYLLSDIQNYNNLPDHMISSIDTHIFDKNMLTSMNNEKYKDLDNNKIISIDNNNYEYLDIIDNLDIKLCSKMFWNMNDRYKN
jgi:hypothetical protein